MKTQRKTTIDASKVTCKTTVIKNELKGNSSPHRYFIEHLTGVFKEPPRKHI
jgi:hypothetical protein